MRSPGCLARRLLATLKDRSTIPGMGNNNVLVTKSYWPTLVSSVCYATLDSAYADRGFKPQSADSASGDRGFKPQSAEADQ